jgi:predicted nicotinamide N-methyase
LNRGADGGLPDDPGRHEAFILANTNLISPAHVPEIRLHLASAVNELWYRTEEELGRMGIAPPFWAFAWAGGQALARYILDHPATVRGRSVVDFAAGSGLVGIAAARAGAARVTSIDTEPLSRAAVALNARANGVALAFAGEDPIGTVPDCDILLAGDVFYDRELARRILPWFTALAAAGIGILVGDPGRAYLPKARLSRLALYEVPSTLELEDAEIKRTAVWRFT